PEYAIAVFGVSRAGGISTTVNPLSTAGEIRTQLRDSGARYLLTLPPFLSCCLDAVQGTRVQEIYVFGEAEGAKPATELMAAGGPAPAVSIDPARDLVTLPYSSGTTGVAKGVMLTHRNVVANMAQVQSLLRIQPADVSLAVAPFFHVLGLAVI